MSAKFLNQIILSLIGIIIILTSFIIFLYQNKNKNNNYNNDNKDIDSKSDFNFLNSLIKIQNELNDPNKQILYLKEISNLYENYLINNLSQEIKDYIHLDLARINFKLKQIYQNKYLSINDIRGKEFDSFQSRLILANSYNLKSMNNYLLIKDNNKNKNKNNFCRTIIDSIEFLDKEMKLNINKNDYTNNIMNKLNINDDEIKFISETCNILK
jgi:hypothetical protein